MPIGIIRIVRSFGHRQLYDDYNRTKEGAIAVEYIVMDMEWNQALNFSEMVKDPVFLTGEIIQIGAIKLNQTLEVVDSFNERIAPQYYTELHPKVAEITKLSNRDLLCFPLKNLVISGVSAYQILKPYVLSLVFSLTG